MNALKISDFDSRDNYELLRKTAAGKDGAQIVEAYRTLPEKAARYKLAKNVPVTLGKFCQYAPKV